VRRPAALRQWYLSVIHSIAQSAAVETVSVRGLWWREIDSPSDFDGARAECAAPARAAR
jgi:choline kinase